MVSLSKALVAALVCALLVAARQGPPQAAKSATKGKESASAPLPEDMDDSDVAIRDSDRYARLQRCSAGRSSLNMRSQR
jgi:hypothetical protein